MERCVASHSVPAREGMHAGLAFILSLGEAAASPFGLSRVLTICLGVARIRWLQQFFLTTRVREQDEDDWGKVKEF